MNLVAGTLGADHGNVRADQARTGRLVARPLASHASSYRVDVDTAENLIAYPLTAREGKGPASSADSGNLIAHTLRAEGHDASEDGTGRGVPLVPIAIRTAQTGANGIGIQEGMARTLDGASQAIAFNWQSGGDCRLRPSESGTDALHVGQVPAVAMQEAQTGCREYDTAGALRANGPGHDPVGTRVRDPMGVRRLTPRECEALQALPPDWTRYGRRDDGTVYELKDAPRYRMLGNAVTVNVAEWIARRIARAEQPTSNRERPGREGEVTP